MSIERDILSLLLLLSLVVTGCSRNAPEGSAGRGVTDVDGVRVPIAVFGRLVYVEGDSLPIMVSIPKQELAQDVEEEFLRVFNELPIDELEMDETEGDLRLATIEWFEFRRGSELVLGCTGGSILVRRSSVRYWLQDDSVHEALLKWCKEGRVQNEQKCLPPMVE
jgi:hypothetical protein